MKKIVFLTVILVTLAICVSCSTTNTHSFGVTTDLSSREYVELGRVSVSGMKGYLDVLAAAKELYPECDEIIDIYVDDTVSSFLVLSVSKRNTIATAIKFLDDKSKHDIKVYVPAPNETKDTAAAVN